MVMGNVNKARAYKNPSPMEIISEGYAVFP